MSINWQRILTFLGALIASVISGFIVVMYYRHDRHWTPSRFGGLYVALACVPVCVVSYGVASFYANKWLHPRLYPYLRERIPRPPESGK
jgi:hypothetical protein